MQSSIDRNVSLSNRIPCFYSWKGPLGCVHIREGFVTESYIGEVKYMINLKLIIENKICQNTSCIYFLHF